MGSYYCGISGKGYVLEDEFLAKGGEGYIFLVKNQEKYVAKIYKENRRTERLNRKLLAMYHSPLPKEALDQITWPIDILYDAKDRCTGYIMKYVENSIDLNLLYSESYKHISLDRKIVIAQNLCSAINAVHEAKQVCGDLNPKNIEVNTDTGRVTLVDTDSYHITDLDNDYVYRCEVGLTEYIAPEIQDKMRNGSNLRNASLPSFTQYTDDFALAIHIFAILMNGCHPFACAVDIAPENIYRSPLTKSKPSIVAPQPDENICNGNFVFMKKKEGLKPPIYAPDINILPDRIKNLFKQAFLEAFKNPEKRPSPTEWYYALEEYRLNLTKCENNYTHKYWKQLNKCPWCELEKKILNFSRDYENKLKIQQQKMSCDKSIRPSNITVTSNVQPHPSVNVPKRQSVKNINISNSEPKAFPVKSLILFLIVAGNSLRMIYFAISNFGEVNDLLSQLIIIGIFGGIFAINLCRYMESRNPNFEAGTIVYMFFSVLCFLFAVFALIETIPSMTKYYAKGHSPGEVLLEYIIPLIIIGIVIYCGFKLIGYYKSLRK